MKKIFILLLLFAMSAVSFSQQTRPAPTFTKQDYLLKSKHQKTVAWILLGAGILSTGLGSINTNPDYGEPKRSGSAVYLIAGLTEIAVSIPLFIAASKNKKKAMSLSFKNEMTPQLSKTSFVYKTIPSLSLKINL